MQTRLEWGKVNSGESQNEKGPQKPYRLRRGEEMVVTSEPAQPLNLFQKRHLYTLNLNSVSRK